MKKYINPEIEVVKVMASDIITSSPGTELLGMRRMTEYGKLASIRDELMQ